MNIDQLETPVATVDLELLEKNIEKLQAYMDRHGILNRPHIKTHKIPEIAHKQLKAGAVGITCQKLGEVEVMVQSGVEDIFLPYNLLGESKLERLRRLISRAKVSLTVDSGVTLKGLQRLTREVSDLVLTVLVEFDTGAERCGVQTPQEAVELAELISSSERLEFGGLMTYPLNEKTGLFVKETKKILASKSIPVERVSTGGTHCMWEVHRHEGVTEHRAGMYVYGDRKTVRSGAMSFDDCSFKIFSTVVSRPTKDRGILDAGSKSLSSDLLSLDGHGLILEYPDAVIYGLSEEHGHTDFSACPKRPEIGERVTIIPNHCCVANNLFNQVVGVRRGQVETVWPVAARGAVQ